MYLPVDARHGAVIAVTESLEDDLLEAMDGDGPMVAVALTSPADAEALADAVHDPKPCAWCAMTGMCWRLRCESIRAGRCMRARCRRSGWKRCEKKYGVIY